MMTEAGKTSFPERIGQSVWDAALAENEKALAPLRSVLRHQLSVGDSSLLGEQIIARMRGMLAHIARQLFDQPGMAGEEGGFTAAQLYVWADRLADEAELLNHVHALAIEGVLCERLQEVNGLDAVSPPLLQKLTGSEDAKRASLAVEVLGAQARFMQSQRRMELPLGELPSDLLDIALTTLRELAGASEAAEHLNAYLRDGPAAENRRTNLLSQLVAGMMEDAAAALSIEYAGTAIFLTALAEGSQQTREWCAVSTCASQRFRFALALSAAGLAPRAIAEQLLAVHPDLPMTAGLEQLDQDAASNLLSAAPGIAG